jgi:hypothetical protein
LVVKTEKPQPMPPGEGMGDLPYRPPEPGENIPGVSQEDVDRGYRAIPDPPDLDFVYAPYPFGPYR